MLRRQDPGRVLAWCLSALAQASALTGDTRGAEAALAECDPSARRPSGRGNPTSCWPGAWTRSAAGERTAAGELAVEAADLAASFGGSAAEMVALHDAVRLGARTAGDRLLAVTGAVDGALAPLLHAHVIALQADDGVALDAVAGRFRDGRGPAPRRRSGGRSGGRPRPGAPVGARPGRPGATPGAWPNAVATCGPPRSPRSRIPARWRA